MKKFLFTAMAVLTLTLSACAVHTPEGSIVVDPASPYYHGGSFCPPGQEMKGRC